MWCLIVLNCVLLLSVSSFFTKSANLLLAKEHLIQEVAKTEGRRAVSAVPEENEAAAEPVSNGAFQLHGTVRFGTARYGTLSSGRFAFPLQFSTAIEWVGLFTRRYNCASTAVTSS